MCLTPRDEGYEVPSERAEGARAARTRVEERCWLVVLSSGSKALGLCERRQDRLFIDARQRGVPARKEREPFEQPLRAREHQRAGCCRRQTGWVPASSAASSAAASSPYNASASRWASIEACIRASS